jgi:predicted AlkP superfamily phosphohydrolase/phosphomutase
MFRRLSKSQKRKKVLVIGWDCAPPELVFDEFAQDMPNISRLMKEGIYGKLESVIPAITCPAWMSMMTSKNPGKLGFYGFRNRPDYSYDGMSIANSSMVKDDTVWDVLSRVGKKSVLIGIPQTYPPKRVNGYMITSFLTPSTESQYTYPPELKSEVEEVSQGYMLDVEHFRTDDKDYLLEQIYQMTDKRFRVAEHLMKTKEWDFFMMVEMGPDRIHHGMWKYFDKKHRMYQPSKYENAMRDYYAHLDKQAGQLISIAGDNTVVIVVSDHGVKRMEGGICVNEWLINEAYLKLKAYPQEPTSLRNVEIDWDNTVAWGEGGYYARIFLNVKGREPQGTVPPEDYEKVRDELIRKFEALGDEKGNPIGTKVFKPQDIYPVRNGIPPDLIVYFGDLYWRSVGSVGLRTVHTFENDTGPDDANHAQHGIFIMSDPDGKKNGEIAGLHIMDCAPTILNLLGVPIPEDMEGKVIES